jgi:nudix-type nucleoside diphosphatase (YffH/AdpP family)
MSVADRVRIEEVTVLSDDWYVLRKTRFAFRRTNGEWQTQTRENYDRGNGATILLYNRRRRTVILTRQFRLPAYVNGHDDLMIETPAGLLDDMDPEKRIKEEIEEETGYRIGKVRKVFEAFMSPGSVTERLHFFAGEYKAKDKVSDGGGKEGEGEDIEVLETRFDEAMAMIASGEIVDAKTIMLLQYAALHVFAGAATG